MIVTGLSLALLVSSGAGAADAANDQAADLVKEKATGMDKDQAGAMLDP
jgi:hypothetical protein